MTEPVSKRSTANPPNQAAAQQALESSTDPETKTTPVPSTGDDISRPLPTDPILTKKQRRIYGIVGGLIALLIIAFLGFLGYLLFVSYDVADGKGIVPATVRLRDIAFIVLGVESIILMVLVIVVIILLIVVIILIHEKLIPTIEQINKSMNAVSKSITEVQETVHTVRGTTTFVSDKVVSPFIELSSYAAGAARILKGIRDLWPGGDQSNPQQEPPAMDE